MDLLQWFIFFLIKNLLVVVLKMRIFQANNKEKNYTNQFKETNNNKEKVHSTFIDNTWGTDLADMLLISKFNK